MKKPPLSTWLIVTVGGIGALPRGPATVASLAGALVHRHLRPGRGLGLALLGGATIAGQLRAPACVTPDQPDPDFVVIDELAGMWLTLVGVPPTLPLCLSGAVIFRTIDKLKPGPVGLVDRLQGPWSVMGDDLVAGLLANLMIRAGLALVDAIR